MAELSDKEQDWLKACDKCTSNQEMPLIGHIEIPLCSICKHSDFHYGTWDKSECKIKYEKFEWYLRCRGYDCPMFDRDNNPKNTHNQFFDENHQPIPFNKIKDN